MPEHVHLLLTPAEDVTLERAVQLIKGGYSRWFGIEFGKQKEVWQRGFTDHRIRDWTRYPQWLKVSFHANRSLRTTNDCSLPQDQST